MPFRDRLQLPPLSPLAFCPRHPARQGNKYYEYKCCPDGGGEGQCGDYDPESGMSVAGAIVIGTVNLIFWITVCVGVPICCWRRHQQARMRARAQMAQAQMPQNQGIAMAVAQPMAQPMAIAQPTAVMQGLPVAGQPPMAVVQGHFMAPGTNYPTAAGYPQQAGAAGPAMPMAQAVAMPVAGSSTGK